MDKKNKISRDFSFWRFLGRFISFGFLSGLLVLIISGSYVRLNYDHTFIEQKNCAVVFGAAVWRDDVPSHALFDRTMAGINLYKNKNVNCLVFSGGESKYGAHETDVMKKTAMKYSVSEKDIFLDYEGINTLKTLQNTQQNFAGKTLVFISNDFHLGRIRLIANKLEIQDFTLHAAKYNKGRYFKDYYFFWREVAGVLYYFFFL